MLSWLIVGGGVHGTYVSHYLTSVAAVPRDRVRVLDPHDEPLRRWNIWTSNTGMDFLRSPLVHQLDVRPAALAQWAASPAGRRLARFRGPHQRPSLELFHAHAGEVIARGRLGELRVRGTALALRKRDTALEVETERGVLRARRVVLAVGPNDQVAEPAWAEPLRRRGARLDHVLDLRFRRSAIAPGERVVVVGGGISAAQLALALAERAPGTVTLLSRHAPRVHPFDVDAVWFEGPGAMTREGDYRRRRAMLTAARWPGSMPADVAGRLAAAAREGALAHLLGQVAWAAPLPAGRIRLDLGRDHGVLDADRVVLATGFDGARPGGPWIDRAIADLGLSRAPCGYPVVDATLRWHDGLYVTGPLAELQLGPAARSIAGARRAAEILATA